MVFLKDSYNGSDGIIRYDDQGTVRVRHVVVIISSSTHKFFPYFLERQLWDVRQERSGRQNSNRKGFLDPT